VRRALVQPPDRDVKPGSPVAPRGELADRIALAAIDRVDVSASPEGPGLSPAVAIATGGEELVDRLDRIRAWALTDSLAVAGALFLDSYVWCLAGAGAAGILLESAVPDLHADRVHVRFGDNGRATGIACTGEDGVRGDVPLAAYRDALVEHLEPLVDRLHRRCRRSRTAFWRGAGDMAAHTLVWCGRALGQQERGLALADELLAQPSPLGGPRAFAMFPGAAKLVCIRHGCCLWRRTEHATTCVGCPVQPPNRRSR
jgi:ferric iron reductase protein FhuF